MDTGSANISAKPKAYSYIRFSTPEQAKGDSLDRQLRLANAYATKHQLDLDQGLSFDDRGISAFRGKNAEAGRLGDFLAAVEARLVPEGSFLLVESLDRISRQSARKALRALEAICDAGITVVTLGDEHTYTKESLDSDPMSLLMSLLIFIRANEESETKSRRLKGAWEKKRSLVSQRALTRRAPAWLQFNETTGKFEPIEARAAVVRRIFGMAASGVGQHKIAQTLNREQVPLFGRGKAWHRSYVVKILKNPSVIGTLVPHEMDYKSGKKRRKPTEAKEGYFPGIVGAELFHRVNALGRSPARGRHAGGAVVNVLGGISKCSECGSSMIMVSKGKGSRYLACSNAKYGLGCNYRAVRYDIVERSLVAQAKEIVCPHVDRNQAFLIPNPEEHSRDLLKIEIDALLEEISTNGPSPSVSKRLRQAEQELEDAEAALAEALLKQSQTRPEYVEKMRDEFVSELSKTPIDASKVNACARALFQEAVVDGSLRRMGLVWKTGQSSVLLLTQGNPQREREALRQEALAAAQEIMQRIGQETKEP